MLKLNNLILITVFFLPLYLLKIDLGFYSLNLLDFLMFACIVFWAFKEKNKKEKIKNSWEKNKAFCFWVSLITVGFLLGLFKSQNILVSLGIIKSWLILPLVFSFVAYQVFSKKNEWPLVFRAYYYSAVFLSLISLGYFLGGFLTYDKRLEAIFNSPNYLAMFLAPAFLFGVSELIQKLKSKGQKFYLATLFLMLIAIFLTKSYAGWVALSLSFLIYIYVLKEKIFIKFFGIVFIFLLLIFSSQLSSPKFQDTFFWSDRSSLSSREMIWNSALLMVKENYFLGIGAGNFQQKYLEYQKHFPPYLEWAVPHPHNLLLAFWLSGGLLALGGFVGLMILVVKNFWQEENKKLLGGAFVIIVYYFLHGITDTIYFKNDLAVIFWLAIFSFFSQVKASGYIFSRHND